jgi:hypothetical protein
MKVARRVVKEKRIEPWEGGRNCAVEIHCVTEQCSAVIAP